MGDLEQVVKIIKDSHKVFIFCHTEPDGDALGATLALRRGLNEMGKEIRVFCRDEPAPLFSFLPEIESLQRLLPDDNPDAVLIVDCGDLTRTGFPEEIRQWSQSGITLINIDHHPKNDIHRLARVNLVDQQVASSAQLVHLVLEALGIPLSPALATQLLTGVYYDTGGFKHPNTTPEVLQFAAKLLSGGGRLKHIVRNISTVKPFSTLKLWGAALSRTRKHPQLPIVVSQVTKDDMERCGATAEDLRGLVNFINGIPGVKVAILMVELPHGEIKVSIRTEAEGIDVSRIANLFGGGGHKKASGFRLLGKLLPQHDGLRLSYKRMGMAGTLEPSGA